MESADAKSISNPASPPSTGNSSSPSLVISTTPSGPASSPARSSGPASSPSHSSSLWATAYQFICFPAYGIPKVRRRDYIALDRHKLAYLNSMEKFNCAYCSYVNGLLAYVSEIAGRTEQYWCPIKHALRLKTTHSRYQHFIDYGDAEGYRRRIEEIRRDFNDLPKP